MKYRATLEKVDGRHRMWWDPPGKAGQLPFLPPDFEPGDHVIVFEGETDTLAAWQAAPEEARKSMLGISGVNAFGPKGIPPEGIERLFGSAKKVFFVFDNDDPYENPDAVDSVEKGWAQIRALLGRKARRVKLPQGPNDAAEFFQRFDWAAFSVLLKRANEPVRNYPRLDLSKEAPPTDWLVEDLLVRSEAVVLAGDGGVGKSFFTMDLALNVAGGLGTFLDLPLKRSGRVLYVDEENSRDLVLQRLNALAAAKWGMGEGIPAKVQDNLEYLWYAGVDLLGEPEKLLEEAVELEPELVVIDSLSRVSLGGEENSNPDMTKLMRAGVIPIARETGAAVVLVHHTAKDGSTMRGATAIRNSADQVISIIPAEGKDGKTGNLNIFPSKPRRRTTYLEARLTGDIEEDGWVRVERAEEEAPY